MEKIERPRYLQCKFCSCATNFRLLCIQGRDCPKENEAIKNTIANVNEDKRANANTNCAMRIEYVTPQITCLYPGERLSNRE